MITRRLFSADKLRQGKDHTMKVIIASNNEGKIKEFKALLSPLGYEPVSMREAGITAEIAEDGTTFSENAHIKAKAIYDMVKTPVIADDSGLCIEFLGGAPGVYSARYAGEHATNEERIAKVLDEMHGVDIPLRAAKFVCALYFIRDDDYEVCVTGECEGYIGEKPVGENGFGYDPIFMLDEDTSMAMLSEEEKNRISHRAKALEKLAAELSK